MIVSAKIDRRLLNLDRETPRKRRSHWLFPGGNVSVYRVRHALRNEAHMLKGILVLYDNQRNSISHREK